MHPYAHAALAIRFEHHFQPADPEEYLWGALAPDIRYLAHLRRDHTHRPLAEIAGWGQEYPALASFVLGYRLHCLLDHIDVGKVISRAFPLNLITPFKKLSYQQAGTLVELHFIRSIHIQRSFSGTHNALLARLGISPELCAGLANGLRNYFARPDLETAVASFQQIGLIADERVERYIRAARMMKKHHALTELLVWGVQNARLEAGAEQLVQKELLISTS